MWFGKYGTVPRARVGGLLNFALGFNFMTLSTSFQLYRVTIL